MSLQPERNKKMTEAMTNAAHALGELIKNDSAAIKLNAALEDYERSEELMGLIGEYNVQQELLMSATDADEKVRDSITDRANELYEKITHHAVYTAYTEAKAEFDALYSEVMGELEFAITGKRPCTHDCSSCGGCH